MTAPKPKPLGTSIEVPEGAVVIRPGEQTSAITVSGGIYVLDVPGDHIVDGKTITVTDEPEPASA